MIRELRLALYFVIGVLLSAVSMFSHAETISASSTINGVTAGYIANVDSVNFWFSTHLEACTKLKQAYPTYPSLEVVTSRNNAYDANGYECVTNGGPYDGWVIVGARGDSCAGEGAVVSLTACTIYSCPVGLNWTLSGSTCARPDCEAPQVRDVATGICTAPPCALAANAQIGTGRYAIPHPYVSGGFCLNGCMAYPGGSGTIVGAYKYQYMFVNGAGGAASSCTAGGSTPSVASSDPVSSLPLTDPAVQNCIDSGQGFGQINGVTVCSGPVTTTTTQSGTTTATPPAGGGSPSTTNVTNNTTCTAAGSCTTTTTTTTTSGGSGPGGTGPGSTTTTGETKKEETKAGFCEENPDASMCSDICEEQPDLLQCLKVGEPGEEPDIQEQNKSVSSVTPYASGSGSCPATVALPRGAEFSYAPMCSFASGVRPIVLAIAWLLAGGMIFAWFRS